jgi:hypothetical protein
LKKLIIACNILILLIVLIKIAAVVGIIKNSETADRLVFVNKAAADSPVTAGFAPLVRDVCEDRLSEERKLLSSLLGKQKALNDRENFLQSEERRLNLLRDEILSCPGRFHAGKTGHTDSRGYNYEHEKQKSGSDIGACKSSQICRDNQRDNHVGISFKSIGNICPRLKFPFHSIFITA